MAANFLKPITACVGQPVAENPTQVMIEAAYADLGLDWRYITLEVDPAGLAAAVAGIRALGFTGFNCTIPHKVAVIEHLDGLGESARLMQAVNCVVRRGDQLIGENTDGKGFVQALATRRDPEGAEVTIIGAGGAARAIAVELGLAGVSSIQIVNRNRDRADQLCGLLGDALPHLRVTTGGLERPHKVPASTDILINATSIGLHPNVDDRVPVDLGAVTATTVVADVVFNPIDTHFLREARLLGCDTVDGVEMLVGQGVIGVEYWTERTPRPDVMREALLGVL
jgi:shikimate dehydrogenase